MKSILTIQKDIYSFVQRPNWFSEIAHDVGTTIQRMAEVKERPASLRLSQMGPRCPHALWHSIHRADLAQPHHSWTKVMFAYGHNIEAMAIALCKASGHEVKGEQDELRVDGVVGHRDLVLDGCICDVKSCTSHSLRKFEKGTIREDDLFGYLDQLDGYICGSLEDPLVRVKDKGYLLAIDKQLGHIALYEHSFTPERERRLRDRVAYYREIVASDVPPTCECGTIPYGESGNIGLDIRASYSDFKYVCFPGLRTFIYANGPEFLTKVVRRPTNKNGPILEVDKFGKPVYNH